MNLDSIHRFIEETHIFQRQRASLTSPGNTVAPAGSNRETCNATWPHHGQRSLSGPGAHIRHPSEWDIGEELRLRELEEAKARAAQMEKTMRWWSDCTANWREKWSKVRAERNSAREEGRQLRIKLEMAMKELSTLRKRQCVLQPKEGEAEGNQGLKAPGFTDVSSAQRGQGQEHARTCASVRECLADVERLSKENTGGKEESLIVNTLRSNEEMEFNLEYSDLFKNGGSENYTGKPSLKLQEINLPLENEVSEISALQGYLNECQKILWKEREMRSSLEKEIERLESALSTWKQRYEALKESKSKTLNELERLQTERTPEWTQREIFEREKQGLERENRRLKAQVKEMEELLGGRQSISPPGLDVMTSQSDRQGPSQELLDLQHAYHKLSRQYQAKIAELAEVTNCVDQNEAEVKQLRFLVEELKQELNQKEAELDDFLSQIHKLQRALNEQKEMNEDLETQLGNLQK